MVKALSWVEDAGDHRSLRTPQPVRPCGSAGVVLKIEDVNFDQGVQRQLQMYAISANRYTLFTAEDGQLIARLSCFRWVAVR